MVRPMNGENASVFFNGYEWMENRLENEKIFRMIGAGAGAMVGFLISMFAVFMIDLFLPRSGVVTWTRESCLVLMGLGALVGAFLMYRYTKRNCPKRVGFAESGLVFEDYKGRRIFANWDEITKILPIYYSEVGECALGHGRTEMRTRTKLLSAEVVREIQNWLEKRAYAATRQGLVTRIV